MTVSRRLKSLPITLTKTVLVSLVTVALTSSIPHALADSGTITYNSSFDFSFGSSGSGDGEFIRPRGIIGDNNGRIYVVESNPGNRRIQTFNAEDGSFIARTTNGTIDGWQINLDNNGNLIIADDSNDRIRAFDPISLVEITNSIYPINTSGGNTFDPLGIAMNPSDGSFFVSVPTSGNQFIEKFDSTGSALGSITNGVFTDLAIHNGQLFAVASNNDQVQVLEPDGTNINSFGSFGSGIGQLNNPQGMSVDSFGNIYVTEYGNTRIQVFDSDFNSIEVITSGFLGPRAVFAASDGRIYVSDSFRRDVQVFQFSSTETFSSAPAGGDETATTPLANLSLEGGGLDLSFSDDFLQYDTLTVDNSGGSWTLGGTSSFDDTVDVTGGDLTVNGSLTSTNGFTVSPGSTLFGTGTVGSTSGETVINGTLAPGNSVGTLNVSGDLTLGTGSTFLVELNPTAADRVNVTGDVTIDPGVTIDIDPTNVTTYDVSKNFTILNTSGGVSGTFDTVDDGDNLAFLDLSLTYNPSDIVLTVERNDIQFADFAETQNETNTAGSLGTLITRDTPESSALFSAVAALTGSQARNMLQQVTPNESTSLQSTVQSIDARARDLVSARLSTLRMGHRSGGVSAPAVASGLQQSRYQTGGGIDNTAPMPMMLSDAGDNAGATLLDSESDFKLGLGRANNRTGTTRLGSAYSSYTAPHTASLWGMAIGSAGGVDSGVDVDGYNQQSIGFIGGGDQVIEGDWAGEWTVGVNLGYIQSYVDFENSADSAQIDHYIAGLYGEYTIPDTADYLGGGFIDLSLNYQLARHDTSRKINVASLNRIAHAAYDTHSLKGRISVGKDYLHDASGFVLTPSLITSYGVSRQDKIEETNALSLNMTLNETYSHHLTAGGEVMVSRQAPYTAELLGKSYYISPAVGVRVMQELKDTTVPVTAAFSANPANTFSVEGPDINRTTVTTQANVRLTPQDLTHIRVNQPAVIDLGLSHARATTHDNTTIAGKLIWQW